MIDYKIDDPQEFAWEDEGLTDDIMVPIPLREKKYYKVAEAAALLQVTEEEGHALVYGGYLKSESNGKISHKSVLRYAYKFHHWYPPRYTYWGIWDINHSENPPQIDEYFQFSEYDL